MDMSLKDGKHDGLIFELSTVVAISCVLITAILPLKIQLGFTKFKSVLVLAVCISLGYNCMEQYSPSDAYRV
jgi:hypothetical protein